MPLMPKEEPETTNLQTDVQTATHTWLKIAAVERQCTLGQVIDQLVKEAKRAKPRE